MATFKIEINCDNLPNDYTDATFDPAYEIAEILRCVAADLSKNLHRNSAQWLRDSNGNRCGTWKYENRD